MKEMLITFHSSHLSLERVNSVVSSRISSSCSTDNLPSTIRAEFQAKCGVDWLTYLLPIGCVSAITFLPLNNPFHKAIGQSTTKIGLDPTFTSLILQPINPIYQPNPNKNHPPFARAHMFNEEINPPKGGLFPS